MDGITVIEQRKDLSSNEQEKISKDLGIGGRVKEIVVEECLIEDDTLFNLYKSLDSAELYENRWNVGEFKIEHLEEILDQLKQDETLLSKKDVKQLEDLLSRFSPTSYYEIKLWN